MAKSRIRILHVIQSLGFGGMESRIVRLAKGLDRESFALEVLSLRPESTGALPLPPGTPHRFFPIPPGLHPIKLARLAALIRKGRYDIVHTHNWASMFYGILAASLARGPLIVHGEHGLNRSDLGGIPWKRLAAQRMLIPLADWIVPVNGVIASQVKDRWRLDGSRITIIPNGVDLARFRAPETAAVLAEATVPEAGGLPKEGPEEFVIGMVGRLDEVKDIGCALEALRLLQERGQADGLRLVLLGGGPMAAALARQAGQLGVSERVEFAGSQPEVESWYRRFHLFMNTSVYEGMSNTLLEAMACGLPVVASRVPGNAAWLVEGRDVRFFEPGDAEALATRIQDFREDPAARLEMGMRNRARMEAEFDNRHFLAAYAGLYRKLLGLPQAVSGRP